MLGVSVEKGVLPDKAIIGYTPLPYQRLAAELKDRDSYLFTLSVGGILGVGAQPILTYIDQLANASRINPAWVFIRIQAEQSAWSMSESAADKLAHTPKTWIEKYATARDPKTGGVTSFESKTFTSTALEYKMRWLLGYGALEGGFYMPQFAGWDKQIKSASEGTRKIIDRVKPGFDSKKPVAVDCASWNPPTGCTMLVAATLADRVALEYTPRTASLIETRRVYESWIPEAVA